MNIRFDFYLQSYNMDKVALMSTDKMYIVLLIQCSFYLFSKWHICYNNKKMFQTTTTPQPPPTHRTSGIWKNKTKQKIQINK